MSKDLLIGLLVVVMTVGLYYVLLAVRSAREDWLKGWYD